MTSYWFALLLLLPAARPARGFPVNSLSLTPAALDALQQARPGAPRDALATAHVLPGLRAFFSPSSDALSVTPADLGELKATLPDQVVDDECSHKVTAEHPVVTGTIMNSSYFHWGLTNVSWHGASVFAETEVDADMGIDSDIQVRLGKHWSVFHHSHCTKLAQKTVGVDIKTHGKTGLGLNMTAYNASLQKDPSGKGLDLVFNFHADVVGLVLSWDVTNVEASHCKIEILGIKILSYCGLIEKLIKNGVNALSEAALKMEVPKLRAKLEEAINTKIGAVVRIPLKL